LTIDKHYFYHSVIVNFYNKKHDFSEVHHPTTGINTPRTWLLASPDHMCFYLKEKTKAGKHIVCQIALEKHDFVKMLKSIS